MAAATNWGADLILGSTPLTTMGRMTPNEVFDFYACLCFVGWIFVALYLDLSGFTLEEVAKLLSRSLGIRGNGERCKVLEKFG